MTEVHVLIISARENKIFCPNLRNPLQNQGTKGKRTLAHTSIGAADGNSNGYKCVCVLS